MEKDLPSAQSAVSTQGSSPSPAQIPSSLVSSDPPAASSHRAKSLSLTENSTEPGQLSSQPPPHTGSKLTDPPPSSEGSKPFTCKPALKTVSTKPCSPDKPTLVTPANCPTTQTPAVSSNSKVSSTSTSTSASLAATSPADSPSASTPTVASAPTTPKKRTFASVAKRVIIQERLRKAEEEDKDEEEGNYSSYFVYGIQLAQAKIRLCVCRGDKPCAMFWNVFPRAGA